MADAKTKTYRRAYEQERRQKLQSALGNLRDVVTSIGNVRDSEYNNNSDVLSAATFMLKMLIPPVNPANDIDVTGASSEEVASSPRQVYVPDEESAILGSSTELRRSTGRPKKTKRSELEDDIEEEKPFKKAKIESAPEVDVNERAELAWDHRREEFAELEKVKEILKASLPPGVNGVRDGEKEVTEAPSEAKSGAEPDAMVIDSVPERPSVPLKFSSDWTPHENVTFFNSESLTSSTEYSGMVNSMRCELMLRTLDETSEAEHFVPLEAVLPSEATSMGLPWNISGRYDIWSPRSSMTEPDDSYDSEIDLDSIDWSREWENL